MNRFIQKNKFILVLLTIVICLSCAYGLTVKLDPTVNAAATSKTSATDYSWATMSQAAAQYLGQTTSPDGTHGADVNVPSSSTGFAGAFLGYLTPDNESNYSVASLESANTVSYSYTTLDKFSSMFDSNGTAWRDSAKVYAGFGYALTSSGIDEPVIIGQTADDKRNIIGPIVLIIFLLCMALPKFFEMVLTFLSVANPFRLFLGSGSVLRSIVPSIATGAGFDNRNTAVQSTMSNALNTLADTVTGLYNALYNLSFAAVIPIMIALALFAWLVLRKSAGSVFKNLIIRVVFIGLGVPLMLACYTAAIDSVKDFTIKASTGTPITVITSTFCDYGTWVLGKFSSGFDYMQLPTGVTLKVNQSGDTYEYDNTSTSDRRLVQLLNAKANYIFAIDTPLSDETSAEKIAEDDIKLVSSVSGTSSEAKTKAVINLLQSYTKGEYITAGNLATKLNSVFSYHSENVQKQYMILFNQSNNWSDFDPKYVAGFKHDVPDGAFIVDIDDASAKSFAENRLVGTSLVDNSRNLFYTTGTSGFAPGSYSGAGTSPFCKMAAYNMLSSTFSDTAVTVYSTTATSTNQVQLAHYSVSIAGQGYMELAYVFDACAIMCCLMVLGYGYGFALLFACFKGLIQIFPKVLTGMIGSIKGIAGSVALIAALIVEIIGTCIMYALGSMFVEGIYRLIEEPLAKILTSVADLPAQAAALVTIVASAIIIIKLTMTLLKYRTAVVKSVSETATSFINKFMQTNVVTPNLESGMSAGNLASIGLGMAMVGASTPAGSKLADRASELTNKVANVDADKVATATMSGSTLTGEHGEKYANLADAEAAKAENDTHSDVSAASGGHYDSNISSVSDTPSAKTSDDVASDYVDDNSADFEKSIGYNSSSDSDSSDSGSLADNSENLKNQGFSGMTGKVQTHDVNGEPITEEYENGRLVAKYDASGKKIVDNSTEEITGTKTTDVSSTTSDDTETGNKSTGKISSGDAQSSSAPANKMIMTDSNGNQQEVSIVNAKTGAAYTQADKDAGVNYDVIGSDGKSIYGNLNGGMSSNTIAMQNGEATVMVAPGSGGTNSFGGGGMYTLSQAPAPEVQAPIQTGSGNTTQNVTQNVTNLNQGTTTQQPQAPIQTGSGNTTQNVTQNVTNLNQGTTTQQSQTVVQTEANAGNSGSAPINVNVAANNVTPATPVMNMPAGGGSGATYVNVNAPVSGGESGGSSAPVSTNTVEHETVQTVMQQTTESVVYQNNGSSVPNMPTGGSSQNNTFVTNNHNTTNNQSNVNNQNNTSNNVNNNVNNQSNTMNNSGESSSRGIFGSGSNENSRRK